MNVWLVNHYALPPSDTGITRHHDFAKSLGQLGHDVTIVASSFDHYRRVDDRVESGQRHSIQTIDSVRYAWLRTPPYGSGTAARSRNMASFAWALARRARRLPVPPPDVVLGSSPHLLTPFGAWYASRRVRAAFVFEVRDVWPDALVELGGPSPHHPAVRMLRRIERFLYRRADRIVSVLPRFEDHLVRAGGDPARLRYIPNGVPAPTAPVAPIPPRDGPLTLTYAGTFGHANQLGVVLDAARLLEAAPGGSPIHWRLVGLGPDADTLRERVGVERLSSVSIEGPVAKLDVAAVLARSHACLLHLRDSPVFRYGVSPNKLFDYFAAGRPVLFAVRTPADPVAQAGAGISCAPSDPAALAAAAADLAARPPAELVEMGMNGRRFLEEHHVVERLAERMATTLSEAMSEAAR